MKTAISVPDDVFEGVERLAQRTGRSRSELFSSAMAQYLASHDPERVTAAIDRVVATLDQQGDDFPTEVARHTLADVEW
jgi:metal-responsive CopG/Arc/MetJ family transcriptional regulator